MFKDLSSHVGQLRWLRGSVTGRIAINAALLATGLALAYFYFGPSIFPLDRIQNFGDAGQMVWNLWIADYLIGLGKSPFFTDLAYWPVGANLATHTLSVGYFPLVHIMHWILGNKYITYVTSFNLAIWLSLSLNWFFTYKCQRELNVPAAIAAFPATAFTFGAFFEASFMDLNHVCGFFLALAGWFIIRYYKNPKNSDIYGLAVTGAVSLYFSPEFTAFIVLAMIPAAIGCLLYDQSRRRLIEILFERQRIKHFIGAGAIAIVLAAPFLAAFFKTHVPGYNLDEQARFSADLLGYFLPASQTNDLYPAWMHFATSPIAFLGFPTIAIVIGTVIWAPSRFVKIGFMIILIFLVLALGPVLHVAGNNTHIPLPYKWLWQLGMLPSFRTPCRFVIVVLFIAALINGEGLAKLAKRATAVQPILGFLVTASLCAALAIDVYAPHPPKFGWQPEPGLYTIKPGPVLSLPHPVIHGYVGLAQVVHHQPTLSGAVVRLSPAMNDQFWRIENALKAGGQHVIDMLRHYKVRTVLLIPTAGLPPDMLSTMGQTLEIARSLKGIDIVDVREPPLTFPGMPLKAPPPGVGANSDLVRPIPCGGRLQLETPKPIAAPEMEISVGDEGAPYTVEFYRAGKKLAAVKLPRRHQDGLRYHVLRLPDDATHGLDQVDVVASGCGYLGHIIFHPDPK